MDWAAAIERNRIALLRIVGMLFCMADGAEGEPVQRLSHPIYRAVLRLLYPLECAVRRLIVVAARGLTLPTVPPRPVPESLKSLPRKPKTRLAFPLCDPWPQLEPPVKRVKARIFAFRDGELVQIFGPPLRPARTVLQADDTSAVHLGLRLAAVQSALQHLPRQAKRLLRWQAKMAKRPPEKFRNALKPGQPPGLSRRGPEHEVQVLLRECHWLAWQSARANTS